MDPSIRGISRVQTLASASWAGRFRERQVPDRANEELLDKAGEGNILPYANMEDVPMDSFVRVMKALSDPNRVRIVKMLQRRMMCVCELQAALGVAQPTVSKHLKILEEAGLVSRRKDGLWVNYTVSDGSTSPYAASMLGNLRHWLAEDRELADLLDKIKDLDRTVLCARETPAV